jgi:hypothetical protein
MTTAYVALLTLSLDGQSTRFSSAARSLTCRFIAEIKDASLLSKPSGRGDRLRTRDLRIWNPLLYQLSYSPVASRRYLVSLWTLWPAQARQNFLNSSLPDVVFLFLVVL